MSETRKIILETTSRLLETQGFHATGLNQIIQESGAPKGSLYYHFPGGKEELAINAVQQIGENFASYIQEYLSENSPIEDALFDFINQIAARVEISNFSAGGPLTTIAMETATTSGGINLACQTAFSQIQEAFASKLIFAGFSLEKANSLAIFITSAIEGGIVLSRTYHNGDLLREVADQLCQILRGFNND